jgi:outer membrane protein OmpA-like peptidoglycan-associated protein
MAKPVPLRICLVLIVLLHAGPLCGEETAVEWVDQPFFITGMFQYYFFPVLAPFDFWAYLKPDPGFRAALGYEWRQFAFSLESGYTHLAGIDPYRIYVEDLHLFPLLFKFGYTFRLPKGFGIQPEAGFGAVFYKTIHDSTIHPGPRNMQESFTANMTASLRLNLVWEIYRVPTLRLHIGGGVDIIPEHEGPIVMPAIEAGITVKPRLPRRVSPPPEVPELPPETPPETDTELFEDIRETVKDDEDITVDEVVRGILMTIWNIHHVPDSDRILPAEYPRLDMIANALKLVPANRSFLVEGHVADVPSPVENMDLSIRRAERMVEALVQRGIERERFVLRAWGGTKPLGDNTTEAGRRLNRRVGITILKEGLTE